RRCSRVACSLFSKIEEINIKCSNKLADKTNKPTYKECFEAIFKKGSLCFPLLLKRLILLCFRWQVFLLFICHFSFLLYVFSFFNLASFFSRFLSSLFDTLFACKSFSS